MTGIDTIRRWAANQDWHRLSWIVAIEIALLMAAAAFFLPGGEDLFRYYLPFSNGCLTCGFLPYFARWILWPLAYIPTDLAWPIWTGISLAGWLYLSRKTGANPALVLLAFPMFGQIWLGQVDVLVSAGLALALLGRSGYWRGAGMALALIKPQLALIPVFFLLTQEKERVKVLSIPMLVFTASLVVFGAGWPLEWIANASNNLPGHLWRLAASDIWVPGLALLWLPLVFTERRERFAASLLTAFISNPFAGVYSYIIFLVFVRPAAWTVPLSFAWVLAFPFWSEEALRLAWILPVTLLIHMLHARYWTGRPPLR